jgi:hypothetical protein
MYVCMAVKLIRGSAEKSLCVNVYYYTELVVIAVSL